MNALANSQAEELKKFLEKGYPEGQSPVRFRRYTGQEKGDEREAIRNNPPDILLTNYMMLELLLTRREDRALIKAAKDLRFLVFDELHTYRGRQGADVALLIRRCRSAFGGHDFICVGTSATMASEGTVEEATRWFIDGLKELEACGVLKPFLDAVSARTNIARSGPSATNKPVPRPTRVTHADWSLSPAKRWVCQATLDGDVYRVSAPIRVGDVRNLVAPFSDGESLVSGFDFPIGIPDAYARQAGISDFRAWLSELGRGQWQRFFEPAATADEISIQRPFYPAAPGGTNQAILCDALGVPSINALRRRCEQTQAERGPACSLFWTLGANQVGRAAISGWREVIIPALADGGEAVGLWPFDGTLQELLRTKTCVIVETYPADACVQLGLGSPGRGWSKTNQADRRARSQMLAARLEALPIILEDDLRSEIDDGFSALDGADDRFDAFVGLIAMLNVIDGRHPEGTPNEDAVRRIEGWILGQA